MNGFLNSRAPWLRVETVDRGGRAWDVVLRIDGTYYGESTSRKEMVAFFTDWIRSELGGDVRRAYSLRDDLPDGPTLRTT